MMNSKASKIVIIGGVAGGATAAAKARRDNEEAEMVLFERGPYISFANCGLPYYVGGEIQERAKLFLQTPEALWSRYRIKAKVRHEVLFINKEARIVKVRDLVNNVEFEETYDKLILAPGAGSIVPAIPGIDSQNIFSVKTVPDVDKIKSFIAEKQPKKAVIVGAGFIGLETAEALLRLGLDVTVVELCNQVLPPFDADMAEIVKNHILHSGVHLVLGDGIKGLTKEGTMATHVELNSGAKLETDLVIMSIGVRPEVKLAKECGLQIGETGGIFVNEFQQTSDPNIYAAGDAVQVKNAQTGKYARFVLAGPANKQGRIAGANAAIGNHMSYPGAIGTCIIECLGVTAGLTGLTEKQCINEKIPYIISIVHPLNHVGYYPGAHTLHIKLITAKDSGLILGAQIVGEVGVDKRIDVIATAITGKMKSFDLENLDLAYSPQFGAAHDPIVQAVFTSTDVLRGNVDAIGFTEYQKVKAGYQSIDVRSPSEFKEDHLEGVVNIPVEQIRDRMSEIDPNKPVITICKVGMRGYIAARILMQHGYKVKNLSGGMLTAKSVL